MNLDDVPAEVRHFVGGVWLTHPSEQQTRQLTQAGCRITQATVGEIEAARAAGFSGNRGWFIQPPGPSAEPIW